MSESENEIADRVILRRHEEALQEREKAETRTVAHLLQEWEFMALESRSVPGFRTVRPCGASHRPIFQWLESHDSTEWYSLLAPHMNRLVTLGRWKRVDKPHDLVVHSLQPLITTTNFDMPQTIHINLVFTSTDDLSEITSISSREVYLISLTKSVLVGALMATLFGLIPKPLVTIWVIIIAMLSILAVLFFL